MSQVDWLIRGGTVVSSYGYRRLDVAVSGEEVVAVGRHIGTRARRTLDVDGAYVLPGLIDAHVHPVYVDDMGDVSVSAAHGGVTTLLHFATVEPGERLVDGVSALRQEGESSSVLDFGLHGALFDPATQAEEIPAVADLGVTSFKMFLSYAKLNRMTSDYQLMRTLDIISSAGGLAMVHAENGLASDYLEDKLRALGRDPADAFLAARPGILEAEAMNRAAAMAAVAGCPLYLPHVSSAEGALVVRRLRQAGQTVFGETCPQYLTLTRAELYKQGALAKMGPALQGEDDQRVLWRALSHGDLDVIASDHAPKAKHHGDDFWDAPYGSPQVETMPTVVYDGGVVEAWLTLPRMVQVMSENPARIFGIHPRKGMLEVGSDADLVVWDPTAEWTITHATQHSNAPYTLYEGHRRTGRPVAVMQRGALVVHEQELLSEAGSGRFLRTRAGAARLADLMPKGGACPPA